MKKYILIACKLIAAIILLQTLYFKFSAAPESVYIFTTIGLEPAGRIGIGCLELVAGILLLWNKTAVYGAILAFGLMVGAIQFHLTKLGVDVMNDGGQLFYLAIIVAVCSAIIIVLQRAVIFDLLRTKLHLKL